MDYSTKGNKIAHALKLSVEESSLRLKMVKEELLDTNLGRSGAKWLLNVQKESGDYIPVINVSNEEHKNREWARKSMSAWGLAEFGKAINEKTYVDSAERYYNYIKKVINNSDSMDNNYLVFAYLGQLALALDKKDDALIFALKIKNNIENIPYNDITYAQVSSFFILISTIDQKIDYLSPAIVYADKVLSNFKKENETKPFLAKYSELPNTFFLLYKRTGNLLYKETSKEMLLFTLRHQSSSGSFKVKEGSDMDNTRLHGKIIEILPHLELLSEETKNICKEAYKNSISWMKDCQYSKENSPNTNGVEKKIIIGGFKQNNESPDVWIDSVGHLLLGISRKIHPQTEFIESWAKKILGPQTIYPLLLSPTVFQISNNYKNKKCFFQKRFLFEFSILKIVIKTLIFLKIKNDHLNLSKITNIVSNMKLLNFLYTNSILSNKSILKQDNLAKSLYYVFFENTPGFFRVNFTTVYDEKNTDGKISNTEYSHGFSKHWDTAVGQAFGEIFERYFHSLYLTKNLIKKTVKEINKAGRIDLEKLVRFSSKQMQKNKNRYWDESSSFYWDSVIRISTGEKLLAPAQLIYWNYITKEEPKLRESNTSGLGGGFTVEQATLSGLYELIERDAFFLHWLSGVSPEKIDPKTIPSEEFQELYEESAKKGVEIIILMAKVDTAIPVFFTILHDKSKDGPTYVLGGSCKADPIKAILRSVDEAWSIYFWSRLKYKGEYESLPQNYVPFETKISSNERISIWSNKNMEGKLNFFTQSRMKDFNEINFTYPKIFKNEKEELSHAIKQIEKLGDGYEVYMHAQKNGLLDKAEYHSVRVIVPGLSTMYYNEENIPLENDRLKQFNKKHQLPTDFINPLLHIFP